MTENLKMYGQMSKNKLTENSVEFTEFFKHLFFSTKCIPTFTIY